ncbi:hypothetical protein [Mucilaginibacter defluvii]|uniref:Uncharacterized protein n=1 Tax=Mucilaginibacter defluvii TaxID=1196019 RepID=A0ABP9FX96_9SPHI|nr:hypothetical protein [Bacteroidota bacterium]
MDAGRPIALFFDAIRKDPRIGLSHIGLFAVLVGYWQQLGCPEAISAYAHEIMPLAKVSGTTYHRCLRDLADFGYILYEPSFKRNKPSTVRLRS